MAVSRCKHLNGEITEISDAIQNAKYRNGKIVEWGYLEIDWVTGYFFKCMDCNRGFFFRNQLDSPNWFQRIYAQFVGMKGGSHDVD